MRSTLTSIIAFVVLATAGLGAGQAKAEWREAAMDVSGYVDHAVRPRPGDGHRGRVQQAAKERISLDQAVNMVESRSGGKVIGARTDRRGNRVTHRIKVLREGGKVRTYSVDAMSGAIR